MVQMQWTNPKFGYCLIWIDDNKKLLEHTLISGIDDGWTSCTQTHSFHAVDFHCCLKLTQNDTEELAICFPGIRCFYFDINRLPSTTTDFVLLNEYILSVFPTWFCGYKNNVGNSACVIIRYIFLLSQLKIFCIVNGFPRKTKLLYNQQPSLSQQRLQYHMKTPVSFLYIRSQERGLICCH